MKEKRTFLDKVNDVITKVGTVIMMNLLFLAACIPVVTIGQAWCGLLSALRYQIRGDKWLDGFKHGYKTRFLRGTIAWCITLVLCGITLSDFWTYINGGAALPAVIVSGVMLLLVMMMSVSLLVLNVYIPTDVGNWLRNAVNMIFKAHIWLVLAAVAMWLPLLLATFWNEVFYLTLMIYFAAYYALAALLMTLVLKDSLLDFLIQAREDGTLTAEEGKLAPEEEEDLEEASEEEEEE